MVLLDYERIAEEQQLDSYYVICTNVIELTSQQKPFKDRYRYTPDGFIQLNRKVNDDDIIGMYKGLWPIEDYLYVFDYYDQVLKEVGTNIGLDFSRKYMSAQEIRSFIGATKKPDRGLTHNKNMILRLYI